MSENNKVVKGTGLTFRTKDIIEARYSLKGKEEDVFDMVLSKLENDTNLRYCIEVKEFKKYYINSSNIYREIRKTVKNMEGVGVHIYDEDTGIETFYPWFSKIRYIDNEGWIEVDMHPEMKEILLETKKKIYMKMKYKFRLSNDYSKRRYEMVKSFEHTGWRIDTVAELGKKLKVPKSYSEKYSLFKKNVIQKTEEEINRLTDFNIVSIEEKERNKVVRIKTIITKKTEEEMAKLEKELELQFKKNYINPNEVKCDEPVRLQIEVLTKKFDKIDLKAKQELAEHFNLSIKSIERYILINTKLIKELKELLDLNFLSISTCCKYAKELSEEQQLSEVNLIKRRVNRFKMKLIPQLSEAVEQFKITYVQAEKYSEKNTEEQLKFYERKLGDKKSKKKKNQIEAIDVEYKEIVEKDEKSLSINEELSLDSIDEPSVDEPSVDEPKEEEYIDSSIYEINPIKKIKEILYGINVTDDQAEKIYNNSNKNLDYIEYIYYELTGQKNNIANAVGWIMEMVKPNVYNKPLTVKKGQGINPLKFNNFKGRDYDYDKLERQLLGWDKDDDEEKAESNYTSNNSKRLGNVKLSNERKKEISEHEKQLLELQFGINVDEEILEEEILEEDNNKDINIEYEEIEKTLEMLEHDLIKPTEYKIWIKSGIKNANISNKTLYLICKNKVTVDVINQRFKELINEIVIGVYPEIENIEYIVE